MARTRLSIDPPALEIFVHRRTRRGRGFFFLPSSGGGTATTPVDDRFLRGLRDYDIFHYDYPSSSSHKAWIRRGTAWQEIHESDPAPFDLSLRLWIGHKRMGASWSARRSGKLQKENQPGTSVKVQVPATEEAPAKATESTDSEGQEHNEHSCWGRALSHEGYWKVHCSPARSPARIIVIESRQFVCYTKPANKSTADSEACDEQVQRNPGILC
ncbi:hypothetical protein AURDEDRAFT_131228 [Auricularia subglabra TFB-10046 SS5]|uniref:Uncharacterized protein n=1 Tax=Auricularia subglabra (strain TFB-10046 / SS5) TaxID=717982 RepID=J0LCR7_AURST|nr:hypothetical protein AURDEDRAFT_131228 [Auricularia subglabra TFB-10046 SS5]